MFHAVLRTIFSPKFKQIFEIYTRHYLIVNFALNHIRFRAAMHPAWCMADCTRLPQAGIEKLKTKIKIRIDFICLGQKILKHDEKMVMILIFKFS
jgi:hypothetical protein